MRQLGDLSDDRFKGACIHCGTGLGSGRTNREHVPTRSLLNRPYPENLPTLNVHPECMEFQPGIYRYAIFQLPEQTLVRIVLREYLACEVAWGETQTS